MIRPTQLLVICGFINNYSGFPGLEYGFPALGGDYTPFD